MLYLIFYLFTWANLLTCIIYSLTLNHTIPYNISVQELYITCKPLKINATSWRTKLNVIDKYISYDTDCIPTYCNNLSWPTFPTKHVLSQWFGDLYFDTNQTIPTRLCLLNLIHFDSNIQDLYKSKNVSLAKISSKYVFQTNRFVLNQDVRCEIGYCKNGGVCELNNNNCRCLLHFRGKYCAAPINYCLSNPCHFGSTCHSRLGGYSCTCPPKRIGINCNKKIPSGKIIKSILNPNVIYSPMQYVGVPSCFGIYASSLGSHFRMYININNETKEFFLGRSFQYYANGRSTLLKYFFLPIHEVSDSIYLFLHEFNFKKEGLFNFTVAIKNAQYLTFKSVYEVRVVDAACSLLVSVDNRIDDEEDSTSTIRFRKRDSIYFKSNVDSNCIHLKLLFHWSVQYITGEVRDLNLNDGINFDLPYLVIPPYILQEGRYFVTLEVTILLPVKLIVNHTRLFFYVYNELPVAQILGGVDIINHWDIPLTLDGSKSWNPNTKANGTQNLMYKWHCYIIDPEVYSQNRLDSKDDRFCHDLDSVLNISSPYLRIPKRRLRLDFVYAFVLYVAVLERSESPLLDDTVQIVHVNREASPVLRLNCIHNCNYKFSNPNEVTEVEATCLSCNKSNSLENMHWIVSCTENNFKYVSRVIEFSLLHGHLLVYEGSFKAEEQCKVQFEAEYRSRNRRQSSTGRVELVLHMSSIPNISNCTVTPNNGYGFLTDFSIICHNFDDINLPIIYEAAQFRVKQNSQGLIVAYGYFPEIRNITLCAGLPSNDFITIVRIIATNSYGLYSFTEVTVTVLPPEFVTSNPVKTLQRIKEIITSEESELGRLMSVSNYYKLSQKTLSISVILNDYIDSLGNTTIFLMDINLIGHVLMDYLSVAPIISISDSKLITTAFLMIMKLLKFDSPNTFCRAKINFLSEIVNRIREQSQNSPFVDIQDLGILILSIFSMLLRQCDTIMSEPKKRFILEVPTTVDHLVQFSSSYLKKLVVNQRPHLITSQSDDLHLVLQRANPKHLASQLFFIDRYGSVKLMIKNPVFQQNIVLNALLTFSSVNLFQSGDQFSNFPFIMVKVLNLNQYNIKSLPFVASLMYSNASQNLLTPVKNNIYYHSNWPVQHKMHVIRVNFNMRGKVLITFFNIPESMRFFVIVKMNEKPLIQDVQNEVLIIPQEINDSELDKNSILVNEDMKTNADVLYVGIIPVNKNSKDRQWTEVSPNTGKIFTDKEGFLTIPYEILVLNVKCLNWDGSSNEWVEDCLVLSKSLFNTVTCFCPNQTTVTARYTKLPILANLTDSNSIYLKNNPFFVFKIVFCLIFYIFSFLFALNIDKKSNSDRDIIVLDQIRVGLKYVYLIKLTTGSKPGMGTTSNILIQLEGDGGISRAFNLTEKTASLERCSEKWFVMKEHRLGDVYCVHLFSDYSGRNPAWYCDEIIVHDIQTHTVYLFKPKLWLSITDGVDKLSCSIFTCSYSNLFLSTTRFKENIKLAIGLGYNRWLAMFYKHPSSNHTYVQRTALAFFHLIITNLITIYLYKNWEGVEKDTLSWDWNLVYVALFTTCIALVVCLIFSITFMFINSRTNPERAYKSVLEIHKNRRKLEHTKIKVINLKKYFHNKFGNEFNLQIKLNGLKGDPVKLTRKNLPYGCLYVVWFILTFFLLLFMYLSVLISLDFSHIHTMKSLICVFLSLGMSFTLFEPLKMLIVASYFIWCESNKIYLENRSNDALRALYRKHKFRSKEQITNVFNPLTKKMKPIFRRMKLENQSCKDNLVNLCMYLMLFIILLCILLTMKDKYSYHNAKSMYYVLFENNDVMEMKTIDELYVNMAAYFLPVIHNFTGISDVNHLVGVPRLRQIRRTTTKCSKHYESLQEWTENCYQDYTYFCGDTEDYGESWGKYEDIIEWTVPYPWKYSWEPSNSKIQGNFTLYCGGGYVANLGHNLVQSLHSLQYLVDTGWMDKHTQAVFVELPLFNPQQNILSELSIIFERSLSRKLIIQGVVDSVIIHSFLTLKEINILATIFAFFLCFAIISIKELKSTLRYVRNQLFSVLFVIFGTLILTFYLINLFMSNRAVLKISKNDVGSYLYFNLNSFFSTPLLVFCTLLLILTVIKWWLLVMKNPIFRTTLIIFKSVNKKFLSFSIIFVAYVTSIAAASFVMMFITFENDSSYYSNKPYTLMYLGLYKYTTLNLSSFNTASNRIEIICGIIIIFTFFLGSIFKVVFIPNRKLKRYSTLKYTTQSPIISDAIMGYIVQTQIFGMKRKSFTYSCETMMRMVTIERIKYHIDGMKTAFPVQRNSKQANHSLELYRSMFRLENKFRHLMEKFEDM